MVGFVRLFEVDSDDGAEVQLDFTAGVGRRVPDETITGQLQAASGEGGTRVEVVDCNRVLFVH